MSSGGCKQSLSKYVLRLWTGERIWKGIVYTLLMTFAKVYIYYGKPYLSNRASKNGIANPILEKNNGSIKYCWGPNRYFSKV
jgi:hypothetical protein